MGWVGLALTETKAASHAICEQRTGGGAEQVEDAEPDVESQLRLHIFDSGGRENVSEIVCDDVVAADLTED